jgi:hypothetical protein
MFGNLISAIVPLLEAGALVGFTYLTVEAILALIKKMAGVFGGEE